MSLILLGVLKVFWFYATLIIFVDNNNNNNNDDDDDDDDDDRRTLPLSPPKGVWKTQNGRFP